MRLTDVMLAFPGLLLAVALVAVLAAEHLDDLRRHRPGELDGRRARGAQRDACRCASAISWSRRAPWARGTRRILLRHVIPNVAPTLVAIAALSTSGTILLDAGLSFLGIGVPPPTPTWGRMIQEASSYYRVAPWLMLFPGAAVLYAVLTFNLIAYGSRRASAGVTRAVARRSWRCSAGRRVGAACATRRSTGRRASPGRSAAACCVSPVRTTCRRSTPRSATTAARGRSRSTSSRRWSATTTQSALVPSLAERWEISPDQRRYTFHLLPNVAFSDGTPLTAADAVGSLERVLDPKTRSQGAEYYRGVRGAAAYVDGTRAARRGARRRPTPRRWSIELDAPDPLFLDKLALLFAAVVPAERARRLGDDFTEQPLGSGPFVLREWRHGERLVLARNPRYRRADRPYLDGIVEQVGVNGELAWLMFLSGELDVSGIPPADFPAIKRDPHPPAQLVHATTLWTQYVGLNCQMPPLDDRRVRQALNYAVNKEDVIALLNGAASSPRGLVPPGMPGYTSDVAGYPYDPERARALLKEAGQGAGFTTELWTQGSDTDLKIAQQIQRDLADVGVTMEIKQVAWSSFLEAIRQPKTVPLFDLGWSADFPDPSNFLDVLFHSSRWDANNHSFYANPEFDRLLDARARLADAAARLASLSRRRAHPRRRRAGDPALPPDQLRHAAARACTGTSSTRSCRRASRTCGSIRSR